MSALGDMLGTKNKEAAVAASILITVDSETTADAPTYAVRLEAPGYSEVLLTGQTDAEVSDAVDEFTAWAGALW